MIALDPHRQRGRCGTGMCLLTVLLCLIDAYSIAAAPAAGTTIAEQAAVMAAIAQVQIKEAGLPWQPDQISLYMRALKESFTKCVNKPLSRDALAALQASHQDWLRYNVNKSSQEFAWTTDALRYAVLQYARRPLPIKTTQRKLDAQIAAFTKLLTAELTKHYPDQGPVIKEQVVKIYEELRRDSRNLLFPSLKQPYSDRDVEAVRKDVVKAVKDSVESLKGKSLAVPLAAATAWAATVGFVNRFVMAPKDKVLSIYGGPKSNGIKVEVRPSFGFGAPSAPAKPPSPVKWP